MKFSLFLFGCFSLLFITGLWAEPVKNGFDLSGSSVPVDKILAGAPSRDIIPAIDHPKFVTVDEVMFLESDDRVLGMEYQGISKAYPIKILNYHEIVNDVFVADPVVITYCPLCGSGVAYKADIAGRRYRFGVSGLLYNSDVLFFDRETDSLWSQLMYQAITGPLKGKRLQPFAIQHTTWQDWKNRYPDTLVLSLETGYFRDYSRDPYNKYKMDRNIWFPVDLQINRFHPKEMVLGLEIAGKFKAYPFSEIAKVTTPMGDQLAGRHFSIHYDRHHQTARIIGQTGQEIPSVMTFWFAWYAFHPDTLIYKAQQ